MPEIQTDQNIAFSASEAFPEPSLETKMVFGEQLEPIEVYRNGPRFYVAKVTDGQHTFQIKEVVPGPAELENPEQRGTHSYQLKTEIGAVKYLNTSLAEDDRITPNLMITGSNPELYYASEHLSENGWFGTPNSNFFSNQEVLAKTPPEKLFSSIDTLQRLTNGTNIPERLTDPNRAKTYSIDADLVKEFMQEFKNVNGIEQFTDDELEKIPDKAGHALDNVPLVLCHGEVYPPHIFVDANQKQAKLIDWENARMDSPYVDHASVWVRAFENPEWQANYLELVKNQEGFDVDAWNATVFLVAKGNIGYVLSNYEQVSEDRKKAASEFCTNAAINALKQINENSYN